MLARRIRCKAIRLHRCRRSSEQRSFSTSSCPAKPIKQLKLSHHNEVLRHFNALIAAATVDTAMGLSSYLKKIPNGSSFSQELGHPDNDSSQYTDFATAFADAGHEWSAEFCGKTFPGSTMTNGEAFGDPCCTWTEGTTPDSTVTAFTTTPGKATVCASSSTNAPATTETPMAEAPTTESSPTTAPGTTAPSVVTSSPVMVSPVSGGCGVKTDNPAVASVTIN